MVTVYLRTSLFHINGNNAHVPTGVMVLTGEILERPSGALRFKTASLLDGRGRVLEEKELTLQLPWSKIDHIAE